MYKKTCLTILLIICFIRFSYSGWTVLNSNSVVALLDVSFVNANTGWSVGFSGLPTHVDLIKTTNGGLNWVTQYGPGISSRLMTCHFFNSLTGYVMGTDVGIYYTTNGGTNYNLQAAPFGYWYDCYFMNTSTGWATGLLGSQEILIKTTNGGLNWNLLTSYVYPVFNSIHFTDINSGYGVANNGTVYKTTNSGANWNSYVVGAAIALKSVMFLNSLTGYAAGEGVFKTTNSGGNWIQQNINLTGVLNSVYFADVNTGYACGTGGIVFKTSNGGVNWYQQVSNTGNTLWKIIFVNQYTGYSVGNNGTVIKTTDGGEPNAIKQINNEVPAGFALYQNYPNPFNPVTKIRFAIPLAGQRHAFDVQLKIYDILGREVTILVNELLSPGTYEAEFDGTNFASGIYYYSLQAGKYRDTKKLVLIK